MNKNSILFFFENPDIYHASANWRGGLALAVLGWILGFGVSILPVISSESWFLAKLTIIFPILGLSIIVIQTGFGMRKYFIPSLISLTVGYVLSILLIFLFTWAGLFYFLSPTSWMAFILINAILNFVMWRYNKIELEPAKKYIIEIYTKGKLGFDDLDTYRHVRPSPLWIRKMAFWFFLVGLIALGVGRFANLSAGGNAWYTPYGIAWGVALINLILVQEAARLYGQISPVIAAARQLSAEKQ
ncbi:MAG: hypothetical protein QJT81_02640 [Candidatus Thiothrix putei]|uniref:Uncharacterized protein n=2 Tax=Thiothrix TaxID=1030 RepID=A0ABY3SZH6_9GAMM|nr:hypothetical protein [Thiothrix winogradskyi]UJS24943.1 hypothetical protein L2Y54_02600 [Thiothrix winogradskyi]WGZ94903.1 MAG: hypothetical protein QJT81_02640 [Candidatus Thiothrix putei]